MSELSDQESSSTGILLVQEMLRNQSTFGARSTSHGVDKRQKSGHFFCVQHEQATTTTSMNSPAINNAADPAVVFRVIQIMDF